MPDLLTSALAIGLAALIIAVLELSRVRRIRHRLLQQGARATDLATGLGNVEAYAVEMPVELSLADDSGSDLCLVVLRLDPRSVETSDGLPRLPALLREHERAWRTEADEAAAAMFTSHPHAAVRAAQRLCESLETGPAPVRVRDVGLALASMEGHDSGRMYQAAVSRRVPRQRLDEVVQALPAQLEA